MSSAEFTSKDMVNMPYQDALSPEDNNESMLETCDEEKPLLVYSKSKTKGSGWLTTSFLIVNTALGFATLNFPSAYNQAGGIIYATLIQILMVCLMGSTMLILAYCSDVHGVHSYQDVMRSLWGRKAQQLAAVSISLSLYCVCIGTLIVIGDQLDNLFLYMTGPKFCEHWYLDRSFTISVFTIIFILPLCFCKRVSFLGHIGSLGILAMLYPVFLTVYGYFTLKIENLNIKTQPDNLSAMFAVFPVLGLGYQCQEVVVPIYSCMRNRNLWEFGKASALAMLFLMLMYSMIGTFGYLTFGSRVSQNVMKMYDSHDPVVLVGTVALALKMIVTYPILTLCGRDAVSGLYDELRGQTPAECVTTERRRRYSVAALWVVSSLLLAILTPSIGIVVKYMGAVASLNIFVYPGICLMQVVLKEDPELVRRRSPFLVFHSILVAGVGAFFCGVVLLNTFLNGSSDSVLNLCDPSKLSAPLNSTS